MKNLRTAGVAATATAMSAALLLSGCATIPDSDRSNQCTPTDRYDVEREGNGSGPVATSNGVASFTLAVFDESGAVIRPDSALRADESGVPLPLSITQLDERGFAPISEIMRCAQAGETVRATIPMNDFGSAPGQLTEADSEESVTVQVAIQRVFHSAASGRILPPQSGIPAVVSAPDGTPGVTMPGEPAPTQLRAGTTIAGFGESVASGDKLTVHVAVYSWRNGRVLTSTWEPRSSAFQLKVGADDGMFGVSEELVGETVGSRRVIVVPASEVNSQPETFGAVLPQDDAAVFIVDILGRDE